MVSAACFIVVMVVSAEAVYSDGDLSTDMVVPSELNTIVP